MAMRSAATGASRSSLHRIMDGAARRSSLFARFSSDGRVLSEEERAKETVYIQKMERERLEKLKKKQEKEKAEKEKEGAEKVFT
uniref:ATPase inhibitor n=1 Tax=Chenopodium quinoa TaxID=63459 RepID=A0A803N8C0_CHEQI